MLRTTAVERVLLILAGLLLVFPSLIEAFAERLTGRDIEYTATVGMVLGVVGAGDAVVAEGIGTRR